jgi:hypothetical protein
MSSNIEGSSPSSGRASWLDMADLIEREMVTCHFERVFGRSRREIAVLRNAEHFLRLLARRHTDTPDVAAACRKYADLHGRLGDWGSL